MSAMLSEPLHYIRGFSEVWFARHDEVAQWVLKESLKRDLNMKLPRSKRSK
jgi:hypothetical protein